MRVEFWIHTDSGLVHSRRADMECVPRKGDVVLLKNESRCVLWVKWELDPTVAHVFVSDWT